MQSYYPATFTREMGCTEAELLQWLPAAVGERSLTIGERSARAPVGAGGFSLAWTVLPPLRIALIELPRLAVRFGFDGVADAERQAFMKRFDVYMQRGGG